MRSEAQKSWGEEECFFQCPYCWEEISMLLDFSVGSQTYIEDCEICCRPIRVTYEISDEGELAGLEAESIEQ